MQGLWLTLASAPVTDAARLADPVWLHALWAAPAALALIVLAAAARRRTVRRIVGSDMAGELVTGVAPWRRRFKAVCLVLAIALTAAALARPQWNAREREVERRGRDLVFLIDVSRSMLARDLAPNRLERSKLWVKDLVSSLGGDRVALVAFAGAPAVVCPLTLDRSFFELQLERLGPDSAPRGGTAIGDAIRKSLADVMQIDPENPEADSGRFRDIILITDGEDQESFPVEAARAAGGAGVRIIAFGLGSESGGAPVPLGDDSQGFATFDGRTVVSRLDTATLGAIAQATPGGAFLNVGTGEIDLGSVYRDLIANRDTTGFGSASVLEYDDRFWVFLAAAIGLLAVESFVGDGSRRKGGV
ncbi:MAG: VWA domain-containing protein [Planctomycetota bacterium]